MRAHRTLAVIAGVAAPFMGCGRSFVDALDLGVVGSDGAVHPGAGADAPTGDGSSGSSSGSSGASSADASNGTVDSPPDAPWVPTLHACTISAAQLPPPPSGPVVASCSGVTLSNPEITGPEGGPLTAGAAATLTVLVNTTRSDINSTPCVGLASDNPGVSFGQGGPVLYALVPTRLGQTFTVPVTFGAPIERGTVVRFAAWLVWYGVPGPNDASDATCTSAPIEWAVTVN
jgi:hypothetical protein